MNSFFPTASSGGGGSTSPTFAGAFGDGSDGDYTVLAGALLNPGKERHYNNLTVQATGKVTPLGFKLLVANTLTNAGQIHDDGPSATGGSSGGGLGAAQFLRNLCGTGYNGNSTAGVGIAGQGTSNSSLNSAGLTPNGGNGGTGGVNAGGTGGVAGVQNTRWASNLWYPRGAAATAFAGGAGGGTGGVQLPAGGATAGAGGSGGGVLWIAAKTINNAGGLISAKGGNGGDAAAYGGGIAGGGGGGGGGLVGIITTTPVATMGGTVSAAGGLGGIGAGGGGAGLAGTAGSVNYIILA